MQAEMRHNGRMHGRGEDWIAAHLTARGHNIVQQAQVFRNDGIGRYFIDVALAPTAPTRIAIELYSYWEDPWVNEKEITRVENLVSEGWRVLYVQLRQGEAPTEAVIDSVLRYKIDVEAGSKHTFRSVDYDGRLVRMGWLGRDDKLLSDEPEPASEWIDFRWSEEPPQPPKVRRLALHHHERPTDDDQRSAKQRLADENDVRRQWWEYAEAFQAWSDERERRKAPWEVLAHVSQAWDYDPTTGEWNTDRFGAGLRD